MNAIVLAAGRGERLRPLTDDIPKPILEIGSRALIEYHLEALAAAGIRRVVINLSWLPRKIIGRLGDGSRYGVQLIYSYEGVEPLETAGGVENALHLLGNDPFWIVNGDVFTDFEFQPLALDSDSLAHLLVAANPAHNCAGDFDLCDGRISYVQPGENGDAILPFTYCGIGLYRPELFMGRSVKRAPLGPLLRRLAVAGRLQGTLHNGVWDDIGTEERLERRRRSRETVT